MEQASGAGLTNAQYNKPTNFLAREKGCQQCDYIADILSLMQGS